MTSQPKGQKEKARAPRRAVRSTQRRARSTGTVRVWAGWRTARAGCSSARRFRVSSSQRRTRRASTAWKSSRPCRSASGSILMSTGTVRVLFALREF